MNEFSVSCKKSKVGQVVGILVGAYLTAFCLYFTIVEAMASRFSILFYCSLMGAMLAAVVLLKNILLRSKPPVRIDGNTVEFNIPSQSTVLIEWTSVSQVSLGVSYVVFLLNGQREKKVDISSLIYNDMKNTKSKIIELCEYKNIPYKND